MVRILAAAMLLASAALAQTLPFEPVHQSGQGITGAYEGWFRNPDGSFTLLAGYYNRNLTEEFDIPAGASNRIEPGGPDQGQPTHFLSGRQWGVFTITVPKDFGERKLTWTLVANGATAVIPLSLNPLWELEPLRDAGDNTPPFLALNQGASMVQGPAGQTVAMRVVAGDPLPLTVWVADDAREPLSGQRPRTPPVTLAWSRFRGPAEVSFSNARPAVEPAEFPAPLSASFRGKAVTTATFAAPGEYILRVVANDWSGDGGGGFQCCWTNAQVKVTVTTPAH